MHYEKKDAIINLLGTDMITNMNPTEENDSKFNAYKYSDAIFIHQHYLIDNTMTKEKACNIFKKTFDKIKELNLTDKLLDVYNEIH